MGNWKNREKLAKREVNWQTKMGNWKNREKLTKRGVNWQKEREIGNESGKLAKM